MEEEESRGGTGRVEGRENIIRRYVEKNLFSIKEIKTLKSNFKKVVDFRCCCYYYLWID